MKLVLLVVGLFFTIVGILGLFLPLLPTTPFLLLATWCFMRSSPKLHSWLLGHPWIGRPLRHYIKYRSITRRTLIVALTSLWISLGASIFMLKDIILLQILLVAIGIGVSIHLLKLRGTANSVPIA